MNAPASRPSRRARRRPRIPAFVPVPLRSRADGWTPWRQAGFLVALARSGSVRAAARVVGMARETAYRLRRRAGAESFAAAWDRVAGRGDAGQRKVTHGALGLRAQGGLVRPVVHRGLLVALEPRSCNSSLLRLLARFDRLCRGRDPGWGGGGALPAGFASTWGLAASSEPVSPELVEGQPFLRALRKEKRPFDRLRTSGV